MTGEGRVSKDRDRLPSVAGRFVIRHGTAVPRIIGATDDEV